MSNFPNRSKPAPYATLNSYLHLTHTTPALKNPTSLIRDPPSTYTTAVQTQLSTLQSQVATLQSSLTSLQSQLPDSDSIPESTKLRALIKAHIEASQDPGFTPEADSPLDGLIAYAHAIDVTRELEGANEYWDSVLSRVKSDVATEEGHLSSARRLNEALREHLEELEEEVQQIATGGSQLREKRRREAAEKAKVVRTEARKLVRALMKFVEERLALMLAAAVAGGPKVGDELDEEVLEAWVEKGNTGKVKKGTLDAMWGKKNDGGERDLKGEAASEMKRLLEELMNASLEPSPWIEVEEGSVFVRFLVLTGLAVPHPRDATKLKLVDFGRTLEES